MIAWDVYIPTSIDSKLKLRQFGLPRLDHGQWRLIDTVFYTEDCDRDYVRQSLIVHDGYSQNIQIVKRG
jgi:hypothetical protein